MNMARNDLSKAQDLANYAFWILLLQAAAFIILGILVIVYPATLFFLVAVNFLWAGVSALLLALRVREFKEEATEVLGRGAVAA